MTKQKKYIYTLLAMLAAAMISFPLFIQIKPQYCLLPEARYIQVDKTGDY